MNKNVTALILIALAVGIYFTFTKGKIAEVQQVRTVNSGYQEAIDNSLKLIAVRDKVMDAYNNITEIDKDRLNKIIPDNVDNVRLIIDVKDDIAFRHGLALKNIKTSSVTQEVPAQGAGATQVTPSGSLSTSVAGTAVSLSPTKTVNTVTLSFSITTNYQTFIDFLTDLESSLRIMDISKLSLTVAEGGAYNFDVEVKTYWLKK